MTGKRYYLTTLDAWQRCAPRFLNSHFIILGPRDIEEAGTASSNSMANSDSRIIVLVEADEGAHLGLENEPAFEVLPHPLTQKPISDTARAALAQYGVIPSSTTFDASEILARVHPLLSYPVF
jgi:hypothetical protein